MLFRDLRENVKAVPSYKASVFVRADISLDRALCLNEVEAEAFIRQRINEVSPLSVGRLRVNHKERGAGGTSLWETEFTLGGKVAIDKPIPREEVKKLVQDLIQKVGFGKSEIEVRGMERDGKSEAGGALDDKEITATTRKMFANTVSSIARPKKEEIEKLKKGSRVVVSRSGFREHAEFREFDPSDESVEVQVEGDFAPTWMHMSKIVEIVK